MLTVRKLLEIMPHAGIKAATYLQAIQDAMKEFGIDTPLRQAAFLAQIGHESGQLRYTAEIASGAAYEGRKDLGNVQPGDGKRYKGRGFIQITGRANYVALSKALGEDFVNNPFLLEDPEPAARSAGWYWKSRGLNIYADVEDILTITKKINGGTNGLADRKELYARAKKALA